MLATEPVVVVDNLSISQEVPVRFKLAWYVHSLKHGTVAMSSTKDQIMTHTTKETFTASLRALSQFQRAKVYYVSDRASCPLWVALDYLIAEGWDEQDALTSLRGDIKDTQ